MKEVLCERHFLDKQHELSSATAMGTARHCPMATDGHRGTLSPWPPRKRCRQGQGWGGLSHLPLSRVCAPQRTATEGSEDREGGDMNISTLLLRVAALTRHGRAHREPDLQTRWGTGSSGLTAGGARPGPTGAKSHPPPGGRCLSGPRAESQWPPLGYPGAVSAPGLAGSAGQ